MLQVAGLCLRRSRPYSIEDIGKLVRRPRMNTSSRMEHLDVLRYELEVLRQEHRDLDDAIHALQERGSADMLTIKRLKKQKLSLKDKIVQLEDRTIPDIIA